MYRYREWQWGVNDTQPHSRFYHPILKSTTYLRYLRIGWREEASVEAALQPPPQLCVKTSEGEKSVVEN